MGSSIVTGGRTTRSLYLMVGLRSSSIGWVVTTARNSERVLPLTRHEDRGQAEPGLTYERHPADWIGWRSRHELSGVFYKRGAGASDYSISPAVRTSSTPEAVLRAAEGCDAVVHAGAIAHDSSGIPAQIQSPHHRHRRTSPTDPVRAGRLLTPQPPSRRSAGEPAEVGRTSPHPVGGGRWPASINRSECLRCPLEDAANGHTRSFLTHAVPVRRSQ